METTAHLLTSSFRYRSQEKLQITCMKLSNANAGLIDFAQTDNQWYFTGIPEMIYQAEPTQDMTISWRWKSWNTALIYQAEKTHDMTFPWRWKSWNSSRLSVWTDSKYGISLEMKIIKHSFHLSSWTNWRYDISLEMKIVKHSSHLSSWTDSRYDIPLEMKIVKHSSQM